MSEIITSAPIVASARPGEDTLEPGTFRAWPKIARLNREIIVTEKIDGTNAAVCVAPDGNMSAGAVWAQSRKRVITPADDNYGFAAWVEANADDLRNLGPGRHFGEWWGQGCQRGYGVTGKRFSLFNVARWGASEDRPECCHVVPTLYAGPFSEVAITNTLYLLAEHGSEAAPGFMKPEGIVIFHVAAHQLFKVTIEGDEAPKGLAS